MDDQPEDFTHDNQKCKKKEQKLLTAVKSGNHVLVRQLINQGVNVNTSADDNGKLSLCWAIEQNNIAIVQELLDAGAEVNRCDHYKCTSLELAIWSGNLELVQLLLSAERNINPMGLQAAAECQWMDVVELLLKRGADPVTTASRDIGSLLYCAAAVNIRWVDLKVISEDLVDKNFTEENYTGILRLLLDYGAPIPEFETVFLHGNDSGFYGEPTMDMMCNPIEAVLEHGYVSAVRLFLQRGLEWKKCGIFSPLHCAINNRRCEVFRFILAQGQFDIDSEDEDGIPCLHAAASLDNLGCLELLLKLGANVDTVDRWYQTPLFTALMGDFGMKSVEMLLDYGANVNHQDRYEITPWYIAVFDDRTRHKRYIQLLVANRADFSSPLVFTYPVRTNFADHDASLFNDILEDLELETIKPIIRRMALLESQQRDVDQSYYRLVNKCDERNNDGSAEKYLTDCILEIGLLNDYVIHDSISFYDILVSQDIFVSLFALDSVIDILESGILEITFPIYCEQILFPYIEAKEARCFREAVIRGLSQILPFDVESYHLVTANILSRLNKCDLWSLEAL